MLMDEDGRTPLGVLADGIEVALLAWRPRSGDGTRYQVRAIGTGVVGWLGVGNLRATASALPPPAPTAPRPPARVDPKRTAASLDPKQPFGQRG